MLSYKLGLDERTTMDIDFLIRKLNLEKENISKIIEDIIHIDNEDLIIFEITKIQDIRNSDIYGGFKICLLAKLDNIKEHIEIDIAIGDKITGDIKKEIFYYQLNNTNAPLFAYSLEMVVVEKLQTILSLGSFSSRMKDFYDLYILMKISKNEMNIELMKEAFKNTCQYRKTPFDEAAAYNVIHTLNNNITVKQRWNLFSNKMYYAKDIKFEDVIQSLEKWVDTIFN